MCRNLSNMTKSWFEDWFNTHYYFLLYQNRNNEEARAFLELLVRHLKIPAGTRVLDMACGKGRHSMVLADLGMKVCGIDLSPNSIKQASESAGPHLEFHVHDMRIPFAQEEFDVVVNLFTSFGYTDRDADDLNTLHAAFTALKPGGLFIQDYLNAGPVLKQLPQTDTVNREGIVFHTHKYLDMPFIIKEIEVTDAEEQHTYREQVKVYSAEKLTGLHQEAGFRVEAVFGNMELESFSEATSPRIIIISRKP